MKCEIQHEFDNEPTYIMDGDTCLMKLHPSIPWKIRMKIARQAKNLIQSGALQGPGKE